MILTLILIGLLALCGALIVVDNYMYTHTKPRHSLETIEKRMGELSLLIREGESNDAEGMYNLDKWDFWDSERRRALRWNKRHPHDKV